MWLEPATSAAPTDHSGKTEKLLQENLLKEHPLRDVAVWLLQTIAAVGAATLPLECQVFPAYFCHGDDASAQQ